MKTYKKRSRARQQQRPSSPSEDKEENENDTEKEVATEAKTPEAKKEEGNSSKSKLPKKGTKQDSTKSSFDSANSSNGGGGNGGTYDDDDDDDDNFVAERLTAKRTKVPTETKQSPNKSTDSNADTTDTEYKKFVEEQRKYFDSLDGYSLTVEKDLSASGPKKGKRKSLVSPIKPNEEAGSGGSLPPSAKKRKTGQQQQRQQQQQQQLGFISPIKSGNSSLSRTGKSGDRGPEDENSYDDSFDREIESEFMSQSKSKSRIENSFDSLAMSPIKK